MHFLAFLVLSLSSVVLPESKWVDLESAQQNFVLETKQLKIEGHPHAFNPSIVRFQDEILLTFRIYNADTKGAHRIGIVELDSNLDPKGSPQILQFQSEDSGFLQKRQDPRLLVQGNRLLIVYNNAIEQEIRRMLIGEVIRTEQGYFVQNIEPILSFEQELPHLPEKNWTPFIYREELYLSRFINPHQILKPLFRNARADIVAETCSPIDWKWGSLRGGTSALLVDGEYLAFFHSCISMKTTHSNGKLIPHYFMGAYTFSAQPPFHITKISPAPIVGSNFYHGQGYKTWKPLHVVFPCGFLIDDSFIWIAYGRQDHEVWLVKLDKQGLLSSLQEIDY